MSMPELSGKDTFLLLKQIDPDVKVLLTSGFSLDERVQETISLGVVDFIPKPFTMEKLNDTVYRILKKRIELPTHMLILIQKILRMHSCLLKKTTADTKHPSTASK